MSESIKKIKVTCDSDEFLPYKVIRDFQGNLKERTQDDVDHLISSIEHFGFSFPFYVWRQPDGTCSCLDGHGRLLALAQMEREGYEIPELPVVYIDADDESDARLKLIYINTVSGSYSKVGFCDLIKEIPEIDLSEYHFPELDLKKIEEEMKLLWDADNMLQSEIPVDLCLSQADESLTAFPPEKDSDGVGAVSIQDPTLPDYPIADGDEIVVQCPACGHAFIFQQDEDNHNEE